MAIKIHTPLELGLGDWIQDGEHSSFKDADIILIPGGTDVNPTLYGHTKNPSTYVHEEKDALELALINEAIEAGKFIIGICKGSQMLTAKAGGWLIQDVSGHNGHHAIETWDGRVFIVNSSHHQMCYPYDMEEGIDYELLAWSEQLSHKYVIQGLHAMSKLDFPAKALTEKNEFKEPEVIWYPKIRGLACQSHPEWASSPSKFNRWLNAKVIALMN